MFNLYLSGQPRFFKQGYALWNKYLFEPNGGQSNFNIYLHAWFHPNQIGQAYDGGPWLNNGKLDHAIPHTDLELLNLYRPNAYIIEQPRFHKCDKDYSRYCTATPPHALFSYYYSMQQSIKLTPQKHHNEISVWGRYDLTPSTPLDLKQYNRDAFYIPNDVLPNEDNKEACNSNIISDVNNMLYLSTLFDQIDSYWENDGVRMGGECLTGWHLHKSGKPKLLTPIPYAIIRGRATDSNEITASEVIV